jgi:hypothetical protein
LHHTVLTLIGNLTTIITQIMMLSTCCRATTQSSAVFQRNLCVLTWKNHPIIRSVTVRGFTYAHKRTRTILSINNNTPSERNPIVRFFNPWVDLANVTSDHILAVKVDAVTRTFGLVAALFCTLSAAAIAVTPSAILDEEELQHEASQTSNSNLDELGIIEQIQIAYTNHVAGTSLLASWGVSGKRLEDSYKACCAGSFYSSVSAVGLSAVVNAWLACTPLRGTKHFVRYHSLVICMIPGLLAISTGLSGVALFIGLDMSQGAPISYIGLFGTMVGGILIGATTVRGMVCTYRLLTPLVKKL